MVDATLLVQLLATINVLMDKLPIHFIVLEVALVLLIRLLLSQSETALVLDLSPLNILVVESLIYLVSFYSLE